MERAAEVDAPPRARALRTLCLELERLYNHVADIGAICTDVAFVTANMHAMRLKESVLRLNEDSTGNRLLRGMACLGGVRFDFDAAQLRAIGALVDGFEKEFRALVQMIRANSGARDRFETTGVLKPEVAANLGIVGIAGRASGFHARSAPRYSARLLRPDAIHRARFHRGRRAAAAWSCGARKFSSPSPSSARSWKECPPAPSPPISATLPPDRVALGYVEGWRGEIFHWIHTAPGNRLARCKIKDPSLQNWPALTEAILGNIIPDFPVVNKSFNLSYSGTDR